MKRYWLSVFLILGLFWLTRLYKLSDSFFFFNDVGRDFSVLQEFKQTGKPPLLGPQTSIMPFNQSAIYFYLLFPVFIVTNESLFSSQYTLVIFTTLFYLFGAYQLRNNLRLRRMLIWVGIGVIFFPQLVTQNRSVWNPSFITPLILATIFTFLSLLEHFSYKKTILLGFALSLATAISYSVAPFYIAILLTAVVMLKRRGLWILLTTGLWTFSWQIPTILFELRHNFLLTHALLGGNFIVQERTQPSQQIADFTTFVFTNLPTQTGYLILISILILAIVSWHKKVKSNSKAQLGFLILTTILTSVVSLLSKTSFQPHFIFPLFCLFLTLIASLPSRLCGLYFFFLAFYWLSPTMIQSYLARAPRTTQELSRCAQIFCQEHQEPLFVSVQAFHPYHNGPEFRYLFKHHGCQVKSIETEPQSARQMALVVDDSSYEHDKTQFNELTLLGPSQVMNTFTCSEKLQIILLQRE